MVAGVLLRINTSHERYDIRKKHGITFKSEKKYYVHVEMYFVKIDNFPTTSLIEVRGFRV